MKNSKRLKLTLRQTFTHYGIVICLLFIVALFVKSLIEIYLNSYTGVRTADELINASWPFLAFAVFFAIVQYKQLRFKEYKANFTDEDFQEAIQRTITDLEWQIDRNSKAFFKAHRGNWEVITIIKDKDRLLINSICDPDNFSSFTSFGVNRKNISTFIKNLSDVLNGKPAEVKIEKAINEWSPSRTIFRLFAYPFCIFLIVFGVYMVLHPLRARSVVAGLGAIMVACIYLYLDIKVLQQKRENKRIRNSEHEF